MVRSDAVEPGVDLCLIDQPAGGDISVGLGDHLGLAGDPAPPLRLGFRGDGGAIVWAGSRVHVVQCSFGRRRLPGRRRALARRGAPDLEPIPTEKPTPNRLTSSDHNPSGSTLFSGSLPMHACT